MTSTVSTSAISFVQVQHCRDRRKQRGIDKQDLQEALKHGTCYEHHWPYKRRPTYRYHYKGITYIYSKAFKCGVTCYAAPLELQHVPVTAELQTDHRLGTNKILADMAFWTSNTVLVVDTSGSMREADVWGTRNRLKAVWVAAALDFLAHRLENGEACASDVISVITLAERPSILIDKWPSTWVTYNKLVDLYKSRFICPYGHGPFLPSLTLAESILLKNTSPSCAAALIFLSDGKPSDLGGSMAHDLIVAKVGELASKLGRRLTFTTIGIGNHGDNNNEFSVLRRMADAAADYNAIASFKLPSLSSEAIGTVFTSVATSLTTTQTEMTSLDSKQQRPIRNITRVSRQKAREVITEVSSDEFWIYPREQVQRLVGQRSSTGNFEYQEVPLQREDACYVALEKGPFGEGAERFAFRFYELAADGGTIVGKPLVAKESRLVLEEERLDGSAFRAREKFVKVFCKTQVTARHLAHKFNEKLKDTRRADPTTPTVAFLECSIYTLHDKIRGPQMVLVEERIDERKWHKWNANNGYIHGMDQAPKFDHVTLRQAFSSLQIEDAGILEEGEESDEESEAEDEHLPGYVPMKAAPKIFSAFDVAQAFSHFSYRESRRRRLVCDLQGVYDEDDRVLRLSDPVIHYYNDLQPDRKLVHGRTDRGRKGIAMFFDTHFSEGACGHLCKLMNRGFRKTRRRPNVAGQE